MAKAGTEAHSNTAAVQATNDDASASKLCARTFARIRFFFSSHISHLHSLF